MEIRNEQVQHLNNKIWNAANILRGTYQSDEYKNVIIPMVLIRRFEAVLEPTKEDVLKAYEEDNNISPIKLELIVDEDHTKKFYNLSHFSLKKLLSDPKNVRINFENYLYNFSDNIREIISGFGFFDDIAKLDKAGKLYRIIEEFATIDLSESNIDDIHMGYVFEELLRKFSENKKAGEHYTPREVVRLMAKLVTKEGRENFSPVVNVGDFAAGTGGMLAVTNDVLLELFPYMDVTLYAHEVIDESLSICKANMLIKGQDIDHIKKQDTLEGDAFPGDEMDFIIMNPPFGLGYDKSNIKITSENHSTGRFPGGLPGTGDSQLLFMQHAIYKLNSKGKGALITNGSALFSGDLGGGDSAIRKWLFQNDYVEAVLNLPSELFYNTPIPIYIFLLNKNKPEYRKGKVQLIDVSGPEFSKRMQKGLGNKRNELTEEHIEKIISLYTEFTDSQYVKVLKNEDFYLKEVIVEQPLQLIFKITQDGIDSLSNSSNFVKLFDQDEFDILNNTQTRDAKEEKRFKELQKGQSLQTTIITALTQNISDKVWNDREDFTDFLKGIVGDIKLTELLLKTIHSSFSEKSELGTYCKDKKGNLEADVDLRDTEIIPFEKDIDEYFEEEVKPFAPNAWIVKDEDKIKIGCEINFNKYFYHYEEPTSTDELLAKLKELSEKEKSLWE
jgi:type I restriction enzyme M protein